MLRSLSELVSARCVVYPVGMSFDVQPIGIWLPSSQELYFLLR